MATDGVGRRPPATPGVPRRPSRMSQEKMLERLGLLAPLAAANRGTIPLGDPRRVAAVEFTWLLAQARSRGTTTQELVSATGMRWSTLDQRLRRHAMTATVPPSLVTYQGQQAQRPTVTSCKQGHQYTPENTYTYQDANGRSHRSCRRCRADREAERRAAKRTPKGSGKDRPHGSDPAAASRSGDRRRRDQQNRSSSSVRGSTSASSVPRPVEASTLTLGEIVDLQERVTGVRPARSTIRSYHSRGQMPAQVQPGRWAEADIRRWLADGRMRRNPAALARVLDRLAATATTEDPKAIARSVRAARKAGAPWESIAGALGVSRQAVWKRYRATASD